MAVKRSQFITATASNASSVSAVFSSAVTAGNSILVFTGLFIGTAAARSFSTVVDNRNTAGYTQRMFSTMSNAADTNAHLIAHEKLNISSGAGGSTYRVEAQLAGSGGTPGLSFCAIEITGGPHTFNSSISANGTSTGPAAGSISASSTPAYFASAAIYNSAATLFVSTASASATWITTVDPTNTDQVLNVIQSTNSSLTQSPQHSMNASTRWLAGTLVYLGLGGGAAAENPSAWQMCLGGVQ